MSPKRALSVVGKDSSEELKEVTLKNLTAKQAIELLYSNKIVVITDYNGDRKKDILVRLYKDDTMNDCITQMSYDADTTVFGKYKKKRTWHVADISINQLSLYPVYEYSKGYVDLAGSFMHNDMVKYKTSTGETDIAVVKEVYQNAVGATFYTLTGKPLNRYFSHEELSKV